MACQTILGRMVTASTITNVWSSVTRCLGSYIQSSGRQEARYTSLPTLSSTKLLVPPQPALITQCAGMKVMGRVRRRCKHCFFIMINERLHNWCDVHPRHKQMQMVKRPKSLLRVCSASQHKIRPW